MSHYNLCATLPGGARWGAMVDSGGCLWGCGGGRGGGTLGRGVALLGAGALGLAPRLEVGGALLHLWWFISA